MKQKVLILISLVLVIFLTLTACSESSKSSGNNTSTSADKKYILSFASNVNTGSNRNVMVEEVLKKKLEEKSNGRLTLQIYPSSTLAAQNEMLDALKKGTADAGYINGTMFAGQFPYTELFGTPGLNFGNIEHADKVLREYTKEFVEKGYNDFKIIARYSVGTMGLITIKPVAKYEDVKGMSIRATSNLMPFFKAMGANCVSLPAADIYESIKLHVINGACTGLNGIANYRLAEVANAVTPLNMLNGDQMIVVSMNAYNHLPADLQKVVDQVSEEMADVLTKYTIFEQNGAIAQAQKTNPNFKVVELSPEEEAKFTAAGAPLLEKKAAELDAAGLQGTDALKWLKSQQVNK